MHDPCVIGSSAFQCSSGQLLTALLASLAVCVPVTMDWRTINLKIQFSKVCRSINSMEENVSTRNKHDHVDIIEKKKYQHSLIFYLTTFCRWTLERHHVCFVCPVTFYPLSQGYLSSVLWLVSLLAFLLHTDNSSVYERDKGRRYNSNEELGKPKRTVHVQILLNEPIGIESGILHLTYCHSVGITPSVMSCLPHEIVLCS